MVNSHMIATSRLSAITSTVKGSTKAGIAVTANALKVLEPIILPITISAFFSKPQQLKQLIQANLCQQPQW